MSLLEKEVSHMGRPSVIFTIAVFVALTFLVFGFANTRLSSSSAMGNQQAVNMEHGYGMYQSRTNR